MTFINNKSIAFSEMVEDSGASAIVRYRVCKKVMEWMKGLNIPIYVHTNPKRANSDRFLESMGFSPVTEVNNYVVYRL